MASRGARGFIDLGKQFVLMDKTSSGTINLSDFKIILLDHQLNLNEQEALIIFALFDANKVGKFRYDEFLKVIRGRMSEDRKIWVKHTFKTLDTDNDGVIDIVELEGKYNAKSHPAVQGGKCNEETAMNEFLRNFRNHHEFIMRRGEDRKVSVEDFVEYYHYISAYIDDDEHFGFLIANTWKPKEGVTELPREFAHEPASKAVYESYAQDKVYEPKRIEEGVWVKREKTGRKGEELKASYQTAAGVVKGRGEPKKGNASSNDNPLKSQSELSLAPRTQSNKRLPELENFRKVLSVLGPRGILGLAEQFRTIDINNTSEIDINDFNSIIKSLKVPINQKDIRALFEAYDKNGKWRINYNEFLTHVKGTMNPFRRKLVEMAFDSLDKQGIGSIRIEDMLNTYSSLEHPLVRSKKRTEEQVLKEFIDSFKMYKDLYGTENAEVETKDRFIDYYNNVSASIENDREFEQIIVGTWGLQRQKLPDPYIHRQVKKVPYGTTDEPIEYSVPSRAINKEDAKAAGYRLSDKSLTAHKKFPMTGGEMQLMNTFRQKLVSKGVKGILIFKKSFRALDVTNSKQVSLPNFMEILKENRFKYDEINTEKLFKIFDKDRSGLINYDTLLHVSVVSFRIQNIG